MMSKSSEDDDFRQKSDQFINWLKSTGATISPKIQLADLRAQDAGRGVIATEDIEEDEELFRIPRTAILDASTSSLPKEIRQELDDPWLLQILAMLREYRLGAQSPFHPYFNILPHSFDTLMYWTDDELHHLQGSAVLQKIGKTNADTVFHEKVFPIIHAHPAIFNSSATPQDALLSECHRIASLIMAYAFDLENSAPPPTAEEWEEDLDTDAKGMIPLADMLNADADRNNARLFYEDDGAVSMRTIKPVREGEELFNDYGPLPRADVLRRYGYITDNYAQYDVVEISDELIRAAAREEVGVENTTYDDRISYLQEQGFEDTTSYDVGARDSEEGQFPEDLQIHLNAVTMPVADFEKLRKKDKLPKPEMSEPARKVLYNVLVRRRAMYPSSPVHSLDAGSERRHAMAKKVIDGEKKILQEAAAAIQESLTGTLKRKANTFEEEAMHLQNASKSHKT